MLMAGKRLNTCHMQTLLMTASLKATQLPINLRPLAEKWQTLSQFSASFADIDEFKVLVDKFTKLHQEDSIDASDLHHAGGEIVARMLYKMDELRRGNQKRLIAYAERDAGWVAAVAEWLFELKIVLKAQDNRVLYKNCEEEEIQFDIRFQRPELPADGLPVANEPLKVKERA